MENKAHNYNTDQLSDTRPLRRFQVAELKDTTN